MTTNYERAFSDRPDVYAAWAALNGSSTTRRASPKTLDALGVRADASYRELDPDIREVLVVGRPIPDM